MGLYFGVLVAVGLAVLALGLVVLLGLRWLLRRLESAGQARALALAGSTPPLLLEPRALCFGFKALGVTQVRGNGCLALTPDRLVFAMWVPARDFVIEREQIIQVDTARSHLGKTQFTALLRVRFRTPAGDEDVVAWRLKELAPWLNALGATALEPVSSSSGSAGTG